MKQKIYRQEKKHLLNPAQAMLLEQRIRAVLPLDTNSDGDSYYIRSIYFDTRFDRAYEEKTSGVNEREKIRIRFYGLSKDVVKLERKEKRENLIHKEDCRIDARTAEEMVQGNFEGLLAYDEPLARYVYGLAKSEGLHAVVTVDYVRKAYLYPVGNVRITFDARLMARKPEGSIWEPGALYDVLGDNTILEIKFNQVIPTFIKDLLSSVPGIRMALSKYTMCRENLQRKQGDYIGGKLS